ncbi:MAG: hypothetical protein L0H73_05695 [Nitrococcus sp.]|nr:hypothetical protein [Nitrococcus sp.]
MGSQINGGLEPSPRQAVESGVCGGHRSALAPPPHRVEPAFLIANFAELDTMTDIGVLVQKALIDAGYDQLDEAGGGWTRAHVSGGTPFAWNPERRALLRAKLDAYCARLYGQSRDELRYILDPADVEGADYPSETFRVLRNNELREFGEYRSRRLVLAAWDQQNVEPLARRSSQC